MSTTCPERSCGSALIVAIFLLVVLAALGAFIATISSSQHVGGAYDIQGARAYQAARFGSEWGVYQVLRGDPSGSSAAINCSTAGTFCALCRAATYAGPTSTNLGGLAGSMVDFTVTVSCAGLPVGGSLQLCSDGSSAPYCEGGRGTWVYQITAHACNQPGASGACPNTTAAVGGLGYVERRIALTVTN